LHHPLCSFCYRVSSGANIFHTGAGRFLSQSVALNFWRSSSSHNFLFLLSRSLYPNSSTFFLLSIVSFCLFAWAVHKNKLSPRYKQKLLWQSSNPNTMIFFENVQKRDHRHSHHKQSSSVGGNTSGSSSTTHGRKRSGSRTSSKSVGSTSQVSRSGSRSKSRSRSSSTTHSVGTLDDVERIRHRHVWREFLRLYCSCWQGFRDGSLEFGGVISGSESLAWHNFLFSFHRALLCVTDL